MKIAIATGLFAVLATGCISNPAQKAAWAARDLDCTTWHYENGVYQCVASNDASTSASWQERAEASIRNTPYEIVRENERIRPPPK